MNDTTENVKGASVNNSELGITPAKLLDDYYLCAYLPSTMPIPELLEKLLSEFQKIELHSEFINPEFINLDTFKMLDSELKQAASAAELSRADIGSIFAARKFAAEFWLSYWNGVTMETVFL